MKPHEEDWHNPEDFEVTVCGPELDRRIDGPREALARAAPEMARALLDLLLCWHGIVCTKSDAEAITRAEAAIRKAGVLP